MKPADLRPGHQIAHTVPGMTGTITVHEQPWSDVDEDPTYGRVYVDVVVSDASYAMSRWDPEQLPVGTGAEGFGWLGLDPLRYRLVYLPDHDVQVEERP